jgi:hypothetical protein
MIDDTLKPFNIINPMIDQDQDGLSDMYDPSVLDFDLFNNPNYKEPVLTLAKKDILLSLLTKETNDLQIAKLCLCQLILETGWFRSCYNYNFGNVKKSWKNTSSFTMYKCSEVYKGKEFHYSPPHIQCCFGSYDSEYDFVQKYIKLLSNGRYKKVLSAKSVQEFNSYLKEAGYYTADEGLYLKVLKNVLSKI